jgi:hypothetical protein
VGLGFFGYLEGERMSIKAKPILFSQRNRERVLARRRELYALNVEKGRARTRAYRRANPAKVLEYNARWRRKFFGGLRLEMIAAYGGGCSCCGETGVLFLDLDHIHNDGKSDRENHGNGQRLLVWLKKNGWPRDRYQVLCSNCNQGKARNRGVCPHRTGVGDVA